MTDATPAGTTPPAAPPPKTMTQKISRWVLIVAGIILMLSGIAKLFGPFTLPACDTSTASDTLQSIFKERKIEVQRIFNLKTVSSSSSENICTGQVEAPGELATINYRIYWQERTVQVMITEVQSKPK